MEVSVNSGTTFTTLVTAYDPGSSPSWSSSTNNPLATRTANLGAAADNLGEVIVRIRALVDPVNSTGVYQAGGTSRIDNILVNGTALPAPGAAALVGLAGLVARRRRD